MSQFKDFEGEFLPVKHYRPEELKSDQFVARIRLQRRVPHTTPTIPPENLESKTNTSRRRPRIKLLGIDEFKQRLESRTPKTSPKPSVAPVPKKRKPLMLVGTEEYQKMMKARGESTEKKRKITLAGTSEFRTLLQERERLKELKLRNAILKEKASVTSETTTNAKEGSVISSERQRTELTEQSPPLRADELELALSPSPEIITFDDNDSDKLTPHPIPRGEGGSKDEPSADNENVKMAKGGDKQRETEKSDSVNSRVNNVSEREDISDRADFQLQIENNEEGPDGSSTYLKEDVDLMRRTILSQLTGQSFSQIENSLLIGPYEQVYDILEHTVRDFEGHSTLLIGPRGSGKTLILNKAIESLKEKYSDMFMTIKLNASLHSDDKIALREIARQLDLNSNKFGTTSGETTTFEQRAISDTFANILLTLDSNAPGREYDEEKEHPTPVIVIIDEIEKFTSNVKQTLLYNIFDLSQSSKIPIAVIGVSTMITTRELLEKRVRSRFSQRIIDITRAETMDQFWNNAKLNFTVAPECMSAFHNKEYPVQWNNYISQLNDYPSCLKKIIYKIFYTTKNYKDVNTCGLLPVSNISCTHPFPLEDDFETYMQNMSPNYVQAAVSSLSNLELLLVISAARWIERVEVPHVNFNLAYKEYTDMMKAFNREATTLSSSASYIDNTVLASIKVSQKIWSPKVLRDCWANLYKMGLLFDVITTNNEVNSNNNYNMYKETVIEDSKMLQLDVSLDDLGSLIDASVSFKRLTRL